MKISRITREGDQFSWSTEDKCYMTNGCGKGAYELTDKGMWRQIKNAEEFSLIDVKKMRAVIA